MAGKEEENYLDKLLGSVGVEGLDTEESKSIFGDRDDSDYDKAEVIEALTDINDITEDSVQSGDNEPEVLDGISREASAENSDKYITEQENVEDAASESSVEDVMSEIAATQENIDNVANDISSQGNAGMSDGVPDFSEPELSESDLARLADMGLDTIIEDVSSDTLSVEDLFGEGGVGDIKLDTLPSQSGSVQNAAAPADGRRSEETASGMSAETTGRASEETTVGKVDETVSGTADKTAVETVSGTTDKTAGETVNETSDEMSGRTDNMGTEASVPQNLENSEVAAAAVEDAVSMKKQGKVKKPKKSIGQFIKNIFFESTEETPESSKAKKEAKKAGKEAEKSEKAAIKQDINAGADGKEELDENERLIYEMYGDGSHADEAAAPKKGFFSKIKYRMQQTLKKNQEEDRLEQEAEDKEYEEKKKTKAEKKEADKVKKGEAKQAKKARQESKAAKKAEKPKKVKKPKPEPKPGDILKIKPQAVVMFVFFVAGAIILISMLNSAVNYNNSVSTARYNMENGNYSEAYEALSGLKLNKEDQSLYDEVSAIMYVQRHYESYENYSSMGMHTEAINSLIKGLERYNQYYNKAVELGVNKQVDDVRAEIVKTLEDEYKISEAEAQKLMVMSEDNFNQYYSRIEAYGEAKK